MRRPSRATSSSRNRDARKEEDAPPKLQHFIVAIVLEAFAAATREVGQASVQFGPGCIALYAIAEKDRPAFVRVFEVYRDRDAYDQHLQSAHFIRFRDTTDSMVKSRKLMDMTAVSLATKTAVTP